MSLVYEALQKAEKEKGRKTGATPLASVAIRVESPAPAPTPAPIIVPAQTATSRPPTGYFAAVIACVSVVALAAIVYIVVIAARNLAQAQPPTMPPAAQADNAVRPAATAAATTTTSDSPAPIQASVAAPAPAPAVTSPPFKLTGIMKIGDKFGAVVDGHIVYEGAYVEGAVVKSIERDHVILNVDGHETVIRLF